MKKDKRTDGARRVGRTVLGFVLSAALAVTMMPAMAIMDGPAFAADKGMKEMKKLNTFNYVKDPTLEHQDSFAYKKGSKEQKALKEEAKSYPASFDLRNVNGKSYVTPVRVQNPFGTCWGFAAIAAAESSLLSSGLAAKCGLDANTLHLSEKQISYFVNTYIDDPDNSQYGEGTHFNNLTKEDEATSAYKYNTGGMTFMATSMFGSGIGPTQVDTGYNDPFDYKGRNGERTFWNVATRYLADGTADPASYQKKPVWYSAEDDWSIPSRYRNVQEFRLKNSIVLPDPANYDTGSYAFNPDSIAAIKQQLCENNRAVCISFCAESYLPGQDTSGKKYMSENWAHFTNNPNESSNHAVTIVGWDDNYPKENFSSTTEAGNPAQPEGDGAFLIKNSWGSELNEFPYNAYRHWGLLQGKDGVPYDKNATAQSDRATGYFWLSYYDRSANDPEAFEFDEVLEDSLYCEQTDLMFPMYLLYNYMNGIRMANVFETEATSELNEISVMTETPGTAVSYQVYMLGESFTGPEDGILIASGTESYDTGGYHRIALDTPKVLTKGQLYSVVVKETSGWGDYVPYGAAYNRDGNDSYSVGVINEGESFFYTGSKWLDMSQKSSQRKLTEYYKGYDLTLDNFPIKSYLAPIADPADPGKDFAGYLNIYNWALGSPGTFTLNTGEDMTLDAEFLGITGDMPASWNPAISWKSENPAVFTVTPEPQDNGQAKIAAVAAGKADLVVDAGAYGTRVLSIIVEKPNSKANNTLNVWGKTARVKYSKLSKKSQKLAVTRVIDFYDKGEGKLTYAKVDGDKKITINKNSGKVTIKKGLAKGTYEVKIRVSAAGNKKYNPASSTIMSTIIVK